MVLTSSRCPHRPQIKGRTLRTKKSFSKWKTLTPGRVQSRVAQLSRVEPSLVKNARELGLNKEVKKEKHLLVMINLLRRSRKLFSRTLSHMIFGTSNTLPLYGNITIDPNQRTNPHAGTQAFASFSFTRDIILGIGFGKLMYSLQPQMVEIFGQPDAKYIFANIIAATVVGVFCYSPVKSAILKMLWKKQVERIYEVVEKYGVDGWLALNTQEWRLTSTLRFAKKLERKGILDESGFTAKGERWYFKKMGKHINQRITNPNTIQSLADVWEE